MASIGRTLGEMEREKVDTVNRRLHLVTLLLNTTETMTEATSGSDQGHDSI
jgi:hypothetical protein